MMITMLSGCGSSVPDLLATKFTLRPAPRPGFFVPDRSGRRRRRVLENVENLENPEIAVLACGSVVK
jgi:hypothetical protein